MLLQLQLPLTTLGFPETILRKDYMILQVYTEDLNGWEPFTILSLLTILRIIPQN